MPSYSNGYIPMALLVIFKTGWNATEGDWYHALSPATYAKHLALVELGRRRSGGRVLQISNGFGAYRPYFAQQIARRIHGIGAATPGTSSHGGFWERRQTLAMDYGNWSWVYANCGGWDAFVTDCTAVGLWAGAIMPNRGYPEERWHVVDTNPWGPVPTYAFMDAKPFAPAKEEEKETDMASMLLWYAKDIPADGGNNNLWTLISLDEGKVRQTREQAIADRWARLYGNARPITIDDLVHGMVEVAEMSKPGEAALTISDEQLAKLASMITLPEIDEGQIKVIAIEAIREQLAS